MYEHASRFYIMNLDVRVCERCACEPTCTEVCTCAQTCCNACVRSNTLFRTNYDTCHECKDPRCTVLLREKNLRHRRTEI